tara:strand:- start:93739 stop:94611 length:873 start_codon:yes stop_codon:yes gene_type:complete
MIIIADSGSTKSDWICIDPENGLPIFNRQRTKGLNPSVISKRQAFGIINKNPLLNQNKHFVKHVFFYGAGCGTAKASNMIKSVLSDFFNNAKVNVEEDTHAAIYSTIGLNKHPAVVCILGTGSNCSYYDGHRIHQRVVSLGYSIMDDGSGNYFGRQLIRDYYFNIMPNELKLLFKTRYEMNDDYIKKNLYKNPNPNAYLAKFAEFIILNKESKYIQQLISRGLRSFIDNMLCQYQTEIETVPVHFAGSIAFFLENEIKEIALDYGFKVGVFQRRPIEGLIEYHLDLVKNN